MYPTITVNSQNFGLGPFSHIDKVYLPLSFSLFSPYIFSCHLIYKPHTFTAAADTELAVLFTSYFAPELIKCWHWGRIKAFVVENHMNLLYQQVLQPKHAHISRTTKVVSSGWLMRSRRTFPNLEKLVFRVWVSGWTSVLKIVMDSSSFLMQGWSVKTVKPAADSVCVMCVH